MKIYISGLYSGTNPQPGVGIARSLRRLTRERPSSASNTRIAVRAFTGRILTKSGLQRPWDELNLDSHAAEIKKVLDAGGLWISSIDLEILWLANLFPEGHPNLLTPPLAAMNQVGKPAIPAHEGLPVKIPTFRFDRNLRLGFARLLPRARLESLAQRSLLRSGQNAELGAV